jgi:hypothetical protein
MGLEKRTSAAKAAKRTPFYGTAEAVPFVGHLFHKLLGSRELHVLSKLVS